MRKAHKKTRERQPPLSDYPKAIQAKLQFIFPETVPRPKTKSFWLEPPAQVEYLYSEKKADVLPVDMQSRFHEYKSQNQNKTFMHTDGSKQGDKVGFGVAIAHLGYGKRPGAQPELSNGRG